MWNITRVLQRFPLWSYIKAELAFYPTPININYFWNFGSLAGVALAIQIVSGLFLVNHYVPHTSLAFSSIEHIMRDVRYGWLIRYTHSNGSSFFFIVLYLHMARGLYYRSYMRPRVLVWFTGLVIFLLAMGTAFMGYVLPWGQMSFWGATVITNMVTAVPYFGQEIAYWLWGGWSIDNATLQRFFMIHYLLPMLITSLVIVHIYLLHLVGSSNPTGIFSVENLRFGTYFWIKDFFGLMVYMSCFSFVVCFYPNAMGHPDNYVKANPLKTPQHIVPEWYFLPFYAILRCIPHKAGGIIAMLGAILMFFVLPFVDKGSIRDPYLKVSGFRASLWLWYWNALFLGYLGGKPIGVAYTFGAQISTLYYFGFMLIILPIVSYWDDAAAKKELEDSKSKL